MGFSRAFANWHAIPSHPVKHSKPEASSRILKALQGISPSLWPILIVLSYLLVQAALPLAAAVKIGADEDYELAKPLEQLHGYSLYTEVWNDQPPLFTFLITRAIKAFGHSVLWARLITVSFGALLLAGFYLCVARLRSPAIGAAAALMVLCSPGFVELSCSVMQEVPALAPVMVALAILANPKSTNRPLRMFLAGLVFGAALQLKFIGVIYVPLFALLIWLGRKEDPKWRLLAGAALIVFCFAASAGFVALNALTGSPLAVQARQSYESHFRKAVSQDYGSAAQYSFEWMALLRNWDATLLAVAALLVLGKRPLQARVPFLWLALALATFSIHKPWWTYYYIHLAIPLCWCAAEGAALLAGLAAKRRASAIFAGVGAAALLAWMFARVGLQARDIRRGARIDSSLVLAEIKRFRPFTRFMFSDQTVYAFHADIPIPPNLAMLPLKRFWTGDITFEGISAELRKTRPELILWSNTTAPSLFQEFLDAEYQLVYEDSRHRLFAQRAIATKAKY